MENKEQNEMKKLAFTEIIKGLEDGTIASQGIKGDMRLRCIAFFDEHGLSEREIGDIFQVTDRHVRRLLVKIRRKTAEKMDSSWILERFGEFYRSYRLQYKQAAKMAYDQHSSQTEKQQGLYLSWRIQKEFIQTIFSLGVERGKLNPIQAQIKEREQKQISEEIEETRPRTEPELILQEIHELFDKMPGQEYVHLIENYRCSEIRLLTELLEEVREVYNRFANPPEGDGPAAVPPPA